MRNEAQMVKDFNGRVNDSHNCLWNNIHYQYSLGYIL